MNISIKRPMTATVNRKNTSHKKKTSFREKSPCLMPLSTSNIISMHVEEDFKLHRPDPAVSNLKNIFGG